MIEKESLRDYLCRQLETEKYNFSNTTLSLCTVSTIHWLQRYAHFYSILCSLCCIPLWILILPIALVFDIFILTITLIVFIIVFIIYFLLAPFILSYTFATCSDVWNPVNIYRYSLIQASRWAQTVLGTFDIIWLMYCGSGEIEGGAPIFCVYCCCTPCRDMCSEATHINLHDQPCTIL